MGRFSLSEGHFVGGLASPEQGNTWRDDDDSSYSTTDTEQSGSSSDEDEYPHPLGFSSYGKTRFCLYPPTESVPEVRRRLGFLRRGQDDFLQDASFTADGSIQTFPPLSYYHDSKTAPTDALLLTYCADDDERSPIEEDPVDNLTHLLRAACLVEDKPSRLSTLTTESQQVGERMWALCKASERERQSIHYRMDLERQRLEKEHREAAEALRLLLKRDEETAERALQQQVAEIKAREEAEQLQQEEAEKEEAERQRIISERQKKKQEKEQRAREETERVRAAARQRDMAAAAEEAKKTEYVTKAKKLVTKLVELRASVAPFEKSKNVSMRRLNMKKTVKGKVNTLSQDPNKIQSVAGEVSHAIQQAREEDDQLKQQVQAGNTQITSEMTKGKRYLVDLLASDAMVRAQAEGFNG